MSRTEKLTIYLAIGLALVIIIGLVAILPIVKMHYEADRLTIQHQQDLQRQAEADRKQAEADVKVKMQIADDQKIWDDELLRQSQIEFDRSQKQLAETDREYRRISAETDRVLAEEAKSRAEQAERDKVFDAESDRRFKEIMAGSDKY
jgi:hypothetical protein